MIEFAPVRCLLFMAAAVYEAWLPWPTARVEARIDDEWHEFHLRHWLGANATYHEQVGA